jgi:hypothetical protein
MLHLLRLEDATLGDTLAVEAAYLPCSWYPRARLLRVVAHLGVALAESLLVYCQRTLEERFGVGVATTRRNSN